MRALIFQIGLLLFFVSIITLWLQGMDIIIAVAKSFVLFVVAVMLMFLFAYLFVFIKKGEDKNQISNPDASKS
ncbi:hypothetical protein JGI3_01696 [Candidatus Kryptobacter tengchongensis]|nr:hypothetical protein JGI3_01696 [Candidatus Kryptobacter tengchongensis]